MLKCKVNRVISVLAEAGKTGIQLTMKLSREKALPIIMAALAEDLGTGDITSSVLFEKDINVIANIIINEECVVCGLDVVRWVFNAVDEKINFRPLCDDGCSAKKGKKIASLTGPVKGILSGERTALNFLGRLSGVATLTSKFTKKVKGASTKIFDTRKTMPGWRVLEKYAVRIGGGCNHRMGLWDGILIKDNHIKASGVKSQVSRVKAIKQAVEMAKTKGYKNIEVEVEDLKECKVALDAGADIIMLDNMKVEDVKKAIKMKKRSKAILEVSGGITLDNVSKYAKTKIDRISIGFLTHSALSIDFSLDLC